MTSVDTVRQPVRVRVVARYTGQLTMMWAAIVAVPALVALLAGDTYASLLYAAIAVGALAAGFGLSRLAAPQHIQTNEAMVIGSALFVLSPLVMSLPLLRMGIPFIDAYFEAVSGVTTTGLSTLASVQDKPPLFLFTRAWTQWYGGLGIIALAVALVTQPGALARRLSLTEGLKEEGLGSSRAHFRATLLTYCAITLFGVAALWALGAGGFNAVVYALAAVSTGGFAPHDASLTGLGGLPLQIAVTVLCFACAMPLAIYGRAMRGQWNALWTDPQVRTLLVAGAATSVLVAFGMWHLGGRSLGSAAANGAIMAFSAHTTAGFASVDVASLDASSKLAMVFAMSVGGGAGSTAGGIKLLRALVLLRTLQAVFKRMALPKHVVFEPTVGDKHIESSELQDALIVLVLFGGTVLISWFAFLLAGYDPLDSLFEVTSATGTVGLSTGLTGPHLPAGLKLLLCIDMLLGRLEIVALLVVLAPATWVPRRRRKT